MPLTIPPDYKKTLDRLSDPTSWFGSLAKAWAVSWLRRQAENYLELYESASNEVVKLRLEREALKGRLDEALAESGCRLELAAAGDKELAELRESYATIEQENATLKTENKKAYVVFARLKEALS